MKLKGFIIAIVMILSASLAIAADNVGVSSVNNNYLYTGGDGGPCCDLQRSEVLGNTHLQPGAFPITITNEYNSVVYTDHSWQDSIFDFMLEGDDLKLYRIGTPRCFVKRTTRSASKKVRDMPKELDAVFAFRDKAHLAVHVDSYVVVGYIDTFVGKKDNDTLMNCLDQAIIDTGSFGGNALLILKYDFLIGTGSTTVGLGGSGSTGILGGGKQASTFNTAIGYASNVTLPKTLSYIHGIAIYSNDLPER